MKYAFAYATLFACTMLQAADKKPTPGQASNDQIDFTASVILDRQEIQQALGADLGPGYVVVRVKAIPKAEHPLRVSPDDFTLLCRKNGERSASFSPEQLAGTGGSLALKSEPRPGGGVGTQPNDRVFGVGGISLGNNTAASKTVEATVDTKAKDNSGDAPLLAALRAKILPDKETITPVEGLVYFLMDGKFKPKDFSVVYKGAAGRLIIDFQ